MNHAARQIVSMLYQVGKSITLECFVGKKVAELFLRSDFPGRSDWIITETMRSKTGKQNLRIILSWIVRNVTTRVGLLQDYIIASSYPSDSMFTHLSDIDVIGSQYPNFPLKM